MKIKTSEATGLRLDWGVGTVLQLEKLQLVEGGVIYKPSSGGRQVLRHTDPRVCMELIACEYGKVWKVEAIPRTPTPTALAMGFSSVGADVTKAYGKNLAESVARCVIAMRLGDEFEVPDELGVQS